MDMAFEKERRILVAAEEAAEPVGPISDLLPGGLTLDAAHMICEENIQARLDAGAKLAGYKVGFTNIPVRDNMGLPDSTYGYILDEMVLQSGGTVNMSKLVAPKIECEICFRLGEDINPDGLTIARVLAQSDGVCAAFEICDARIKDWKCPYPDFFADNGFSARIVLSGEWFAPSQVDLLGEMVTLYKDGVELASGKGEMAMGHPANAVIWLANKLKDRGRTLKAGNVVMTGTLTPIILVEKGAEYVAQFSTLGEVTQKFK